MSVNLKFAIDQTRTEHLGKLFHTIDFQINENYTSVEYVNRKRGSICGTFTIGNREYEITHHELERIYETAESSLQALRKKHKLGKM